MYKRQPLAASRYNQALGNALTQGHPYDEAAQMATSTLYNTLQQQSLLLALKEILGYLLVISLFIAIVSRFIPFHKTIRVTFAKTGDDMVWSNYARLQIYQPASAFLSFIVYPKHFGIRFV